MVISPDGSSCLVLGDAAPSRLFALPGGSAVQTYPRGGELATSPTGVFAADGQRLYLIGANRAAARFNLANAVPEVSYEVAQETVAPGLLRRGESRPGRATCIAVSADESAVAVGTRAGDLFIYAATTGKPTQEFHFAQSVRRLAFSTHGLVIAVALDDGSVLLIPLKR